LVPNELLMSTLRDASVDPARAFQITVVDRHVQAPMATVLKRIDDAVKEGRLRITNCAMLVCAGRSAKRNSHYAPRILAKYI
jgi:hypothetical protein